MKHNFVVTHPRIRDQTARTHALQRLGTQEFRTLDPHLRVWEMSFLSLPHGLLHEVLLRLVKDKLLHICRGARVSNNTSVTVMDLLDLNDGTKGGKLVAK